MTLLSEYIGVKQTSIKIDVCLIPMYSDKSVIQSCTFCLHHDSAIVGFQFVSKMHGYHGVWTQI